MVASVHRFGLLLIVLTPAWAFAQAPIGPPTPTPPPSSVPAPAPAASSGSPATGYGWDDKPSGRPRRFVPHAPGGPTAILPGFEMLGDGGSRFFVQLSKNVPVEEKKAAGSITYVLRGAHVNLRNNYHALVTVHFNTPVTRARLTPSGRDLLFILDMRAAATPTWHVTPNTDGTASLQIDFPSGGYLPGGTSAGASAPPASSGASAPPAPLKPQQ